MLCCPELWCVSQWPWAELKACVCRHEWHYRLHQYMLPRLCWGGTVNPVLFLNVRPLLQHVCIAWWQALGPRECVIVPFQADSLEKGKVSFFTGKCWHKARRSLNTLWGGSQGREWALGEMKAFIIWLGQGSTGARVCYVLPENRLQALPFISFLVN